MHIIFGSNNRWAQLELLKWLGINSMEEAQEMNNGIVLHFRNPEHSGTYDDKQAHRELITQLGEDAAVNIVLLACHRKTDAVIQQLKSDPELKHVSKDALLLCNDLVVRFEGRVRNSPDTPEQAKEYLRSYCNKSLECVAGVSITNLRTMRRLEGVSITRVYLKEHIPENVLDLIVAKPHVIRAAGAFVPDDPLLQPYVDRLEGALDTVMGLPKELTLRLLAEHRFSETHETAAAQSTTLPCGTTSVEVSSTAGSSCAMEDNMSMIDGNTGTTVDSFMDEGSRSNDSNEIFV